MNALEAFRRERGLLSGDDLEGWLRAAGLSEAEWRQRVLAGETAGLPGAPPRVAYARPTTPSPLRADPPPQQWAAAASGCGEAALRVVCRVLGIQAAPRLRRHATLAEIVDGAAAAGLRATPLKASRRCIDALPVPWIAHVDGFHWVVVHRADAEDVVVSDPARGAGTLSRGGFEARWSGWCAVFGAVVQSD